MEHLLKNWKFWKPGPAALLSTEWGSEPVAPSRRGGAQRAPPAWRASLTCLVCLVRTPGWCYKGTGRGPPGGTSVCVGSASYAARETNSQCPSAPFELNMFGP